MPLKGIITCSDEPLQKKDSAAHRSRSPSKRLSFQIPTIIVDENTVFRAGLAHNLAGSRFRIVASTSTLSECPISVLGNDRGVLLISDRGVEPCLPQLAHLIDQGLSIAIVAKRFDAEGFVATITAGASAYLMEHTLNPDMLVRALELVLLGAMIIPQEFAIHASFACPTESQPIVDWAQPDDAIPLSGREQAILRALTKGVSNKVIAGDLGIAEATVKVHVKSVLRKIGVKNRTQAALWYAAHLPTRHRGSDGLES